MSEITALGRNLSSWKLSEEAGRLLCSGLGRKWSDLMKCQAGVRESASKWSWQEVYDKLLFLTTQICRATVEKSDDMKVTVPEWAVKMERYSSRTALRVGLRHEWRTHPARCVHAYITRPRL